MNNSNQDTLTSSIKKEIINIGDYEEDDDLESLPLVLMEICSSLQNRIQNKQCKKSKQPEEKSQIQPRADLMGIEGKKFENGCHVDVKIEQEQKKSTDAYEEKFQEKSGLMFNGMADFQDIPHKKEGNDCRGGVPYYDRKLKQESNNLYEGNYEVQSEISLFKEATNIQEKQKNGSHYVPYNASKHQLQNYERSGQVLRETCFQDSTENMEINQPHEKEFENLDIKCESCQNWYNIEWKPGNDGRPLIRKGKSLKFCSPCYDASQQTQSAIHNLSTLRQHSRTRMQWWPSSTRQQPITSRGQSITARSSIHQQILNCLNDSGSSMGPIDERLGNSSLPYTCNVCHETFFTTDSFKIHILSHIKEDRLQKLYALKLIRPSHRSTPRQAQTPEFCLFVCQICEKSFLNKSNLNSHYQTHSQQQALKCSICNEVCLVVGTNLPVHSKEKPFWCLVCTQKWEKMKRKPIETISTNEKETISDLDKHHQVSKQAFQKKLVCLPINQEKQLNGHSERKLFNCIICGEAFDAPEQLKMHYDLHKWHKCATCNRMFITKHALDVHCKYSLHKQETK